MTFTIGENYRTKAGDDEPKAYEATCTAQVFMSNLQTCLTNFWSGKESREVLSTVHFPKLIDEEAVLVYLPDDPSEITSVMPFSFIWQSTSPIKHRIP